MNKRLEFSVRGIPDIVLHTFACDVVEDLFVDVRPDIGSIELAVEIVIAKRLWIQGEMSSEELALHTQKVRSFLYRGYYTARLREIYLAAYAVASLIPKEAVRAAWGAVECLKPFTLMGETFERVGSPVGIYRYEVTALNAVEEEISPGSASKRRYLHMEKHMAKLVLEYFWRPFCEAIEYVVQQQESIQQQQEEMEEALFE